MIDTISWEGESLSPPTIVAVLSRDFSVEIWATAAEGGMTTSILILAMEGSIEIEAFDWPKDANLSPFSVISSSAAFPEEAGGVVVVFSVEGTGSRVAVVVAISVVDDEPPWSNFPFPFSILTVRKGTMILTSYSEKESNKNEISSKGSPSFSTYAHASLITTSYTRIRASS